MPFTPAVEELLAQAVRPLPLTRDTFSPPVVCLKASDAHRLFPNATQPNAALAGLALQLGDWEGSHEIAQQVETPEGSYWHAITHRMEPDESNSNYWFRQVGSHPTFVQLLADVRSIMATTPIERWCLGNVWQPQAFATWIREAIETKDPRKLTVTLQIQEAELRRLFIYCAK